MNIIVSDTGPILHLHEANLLSLFNNIEQIIIPPAVKDELLLINNRELEEVIKLLIVEDLTADEIQNARAIYHADILHMGEAEAIVLCRRIHPEWFLTDDTDARVFARSAGIEVHGSFGLILWSAAKGFLNKEQSRQAVTALAGSSLWTSERLVAEIHAAVEEIFER